jgi:CheY-like chemotaxis protein/CHASE3 domain sensor protein/HPt (histidine-containing phosphotransfer) domain-containing protein
MNNDMDWPASAGAVALHERRAGVAVGGGIVAALAIVLGIMFLINNWTRAAIDAESRLTHTRDAVAAMADISGNINDMDRMNARLLLTGSHRYLLARNADTDAVEASMPRLQSLLADDSSQSERMTDLQPLITDILSRLRAARITPSAARTIDTESLQDEISSRLAQMRTDEDLLLTQRYTDLEHTLGSQPSNFLGLLILASTTLCFFYSLVIVQIRHRGETRRMVQDARRRAEDFHGRDNTFADHARRDIRSALTAIIGFCDLPLESQTPTNERFDSIRNQSRQILDAIGGTPDAPQTVPIPLPDAPVPENTRGNASSAPVESSPPSLVPQPDSNHFTGRVLLAEDSPDLQKIIKFYLEGVGAEVTIVPDGKLACDHALVSWKQEKPFDLILMDIQMPNFDGRAATILLRDAGYTNPIIAITANATEEERSRCFAAGCNGFLSKPVEKDEFMQTMRRYLQPDFNPQTTVTPAGEPAPTSDAQFAALRESFEAEIPSRVADIKTAIETGNFAHVAYLTHQLKGTAGCFGLSAICDAAAGLQTAAENPDLRQNMEQCFQTLNRLSPQPAAAKAA